MRKANNFKFNKELTFISDLLFILNLFANSVLQICDISIMHYAYPRLKEREKGPGEITLKKEFLQFKTDTYEIVGGCTQDLEDLKNGIWWMVTNPKYPQTKFQRDKAWRKAENAFENPKKYDEVKYNCESFIGDILLNDPTSLQVTKCKRKLVSASALGTATIAVNPAVAALGILGLGVYLGCKVVVYG